MRLYVWLLLCNVSMFTFALLFGFISSLSLKLVCLSLFCLASSFNYLRLTDEVMSGVYNQQNGIINLEDDVNW